MGRKHARLKIELKSDLCTGSGYSYAGVINSDASYDDYGLPLIPARRLKGCMREAAEIICPMEKDAIFGKRGDDGTKGIILDNAYIDHYRNIVKELKTIHESKMDAAKYLSAQDILEIYTSIRAQTEICKENGAAKDNTLRFVRVVGQYDPLGYGEALCFYADMEYDSNQEDALERILKATRNIGLNRNRGLGSVHCSLIDKIDIDEWSFDNKKLEKTGRACITYILHNTSPLLMSSDHTDVSDPYISGKSILGRLAGEYLRDHEKTAESEEFRQLFLDGSTVFTNATLTFPPVCSDKERKKTSLWMSFYPAPFYLNEMKKSKKLVNLLIDRPAELLDAYNPEGGNQPRKLKGKYVSQVSANKYCVAEAEREIIFHNRLHKNRTEERITDGLYLLEVLKEGQYFKGHIYTDWRYVPMLEGLLNHERFSFGKSKTAQYGICELEAIDDGDVQEQELLVNPGDCIAVTLCSDAIFLTEHGYTVKFDEVKRLIADSLGISYKKDTEDRSIVQTREVTGYHTKWNLKRQAVPAIKAGSVFVYTIVEDQQKFVCRRFVGERNLEGYGEIQISLCRDMEYVAEKSERLKEDQKSFELTNICKEYLFRIRCKKTLAGIVDHYIQNRAGKLDISSSTISRLMLMLEESLQKNEDCDQAFTDFCDRVLSIRRESERKMVWEWLELIIKKNDDIKNGEKKKELNTEKMLRGVKTKDKKTRKEKQLEKEFEKRMKELWGDYLKKILLYHEYQNKQEEKMG